MGDHFFNRCAVGFCACVFALLLTGRSVKAESLSDAVERELKAIRESRAVEQMKLVWDIEKGCLAEDATEELLQDAVERMEGLHACGVKEDLQVIAEAAAAELEKPEKRSLGIWTVTHYCNCSQCCGIWAGGGTASGTTPTAGRTVAADLPFGTRLEINGEEYIVEDRGVSGAWVDIYVDSHAEALHRGMYQTEVFIIE